MDDSEYLRKLFRVHNVIVDVLSEYVVEAETKLREEAKACDSNKAVGHNIKAVYEAKKAERNNAINEHTRKAQEASICRDLEKKRELKAEVRSLGSKKNKLDDLFQAYAKEAKVKMDILLKEHERHVENITKCKKELRECIDAYELMKHQCRILRLEVLELPPLKRMKKL